MLTNRERSALLLAAIGLGGLGACSSEAPEEGLTIHEQSVQNTSGRSGEEAAQPAEGPVGDAKWIIRYRDTRSLQSELDQDEQIKELRKVAPSEAIVQRIAEVRPAIEEAHLRERARRTATIAARVGAPMTHLRVLASGADLVDLGPDGAAVAEKLRADPDVEYIEPDAVAVPAFDPVDPDYSKQWHYFDPIAGLNLPRAWNKATGVRTVVAVVDTGRTMHPDLLAATVDGYDFISDPARARDGNGRDSNPMDQGDWVSPGDCHAPAAQKSSWHGTYVAGLIAAEMNNDTGGVGAAFDAKIVHARALGKCGGVTSDITDAILWASGNAVPGVPDNANRADVINLSFRSIGICSQTFQAAIDAAVNKGTVVVAAAGNDGINVALAQPANCKHVIAVAASDDMGNQANYSNYGAGIDVTAPGGGASLAAGVYTTANAGLTSPGAESYGRKSSTSMAAAQVSGVVALLKSSNPSLTPAQVEVKLKSNTRPLASPCVGGCGTGLVDAAATLRTDTIKGEWTMSKGQSSTAAGNPRFRLSLAKDSTVQIDLSSTVDSYLYLLDESGFLIDADDDSGNGNDSRLTKTLSAGDYILVASTHDDNQVGAFTLTSRKGDLSALAQGSWSSSGGQDRSSPENPRYVLSLPTASRVALNLTSSVNTYLYLLRQTGALIDENDDTFFDTNSRVIIDLEAGEYIVVAATQSSGEVGDFDLTSSHGVLRIPPSAFKKVSGDGAASCPKGYFLASRADVSANRPPAEFELKTWDIARLTGQWALRGAGYGYDFSFEDVGLGHTLCGVR